MKTGRLPRVNANLPRPGHVLATISAVDENGFTAHYGTVETPVGAFRDGVATIHLAARETATQQREGDATTA